MTLANHDESVTRLQKALAERYSRDSALLNVPGLSTACRIDANYYVVLEPGFVQMLARAAGMLPRKALAALISSGNMLSRPGEGDARDYWLKLCLTWPGGFGAGPARRHTLKCSFVLAEFIDRGLTLYAATDVSTTLSDLRICADERTRVEAFMEGKTVPSTFAYSE